MVQLRIGRLLLDEMREDLRRKHRFAHERVGFLYCRYGRLSTGSVVILAAEYRPVPDSQYIDDPRFGAVIGADAFRDVIQTVHDVSVGAFHVHLHGGRGIPGPSHVDLEETAAFVPDFFHGRSDVPHGALILNTDSLSGRVWMEEDGTPSPITEIRVVGAPIQRISQVI